MRFWLALTSLLCFTWMSSVDTTHGAATRCCLKWSNTRVPLFKIKNYTIQIDSVCPITAVVFHTRQKRICSRLDSTFTQAAMNKVDKEKAALLKNTEGSGNNREPTESTVLKGTVPKKRQQGRQRTGKNNITIKRRKQRKSR